MRDMLHSERAILPVIGMSLEPLFMWPGCGPVLIVVIIKNTYEMCTNILIGCAWVEQCVYTHCADASSQTCAFMLALHS